MSNVTIERYTLGEVDAGLLDELMPLHEGAYEDSHMNEDLRRDVDSNPEHFRLFVARERGVIVGSRAVKLVASQQEPHHGGHDPVVYGKRFTVVKHARGRGIGQALLDAGKDFCFNELDMPIMFGQTNEIGALALYVRNGALVYRPSIHDSLRRNSPDEAEAFLNRFLADPFFRRLRIPRGEGILFAYPRDMTTASELEEIGYMSIGPQL